MLLRVFLNHRDAFGTAPSLGWVREVLEYYPLERVLRVFTRVLHVLETEGNSLEVGLRLAGRLSTLDTVQGIRRAAAALERQGSQPIVFSELHLLNFLKDAIRLCQGADRELDRQDLNLLLHAYLTTHDHFPPRQDHRVRAGGPEHLTWIEEDLLRQTLLGLNEPLQLVIPRYWALWVALPQRLGIQSELSQSDARFSVDAITSSFVIALSAWAYWLKQAQTVQGPTMLRRQYWEGFPARLGVVDAWLADRALDAARYKTQLEREYAGLGRDEVWEYSFLTLSNCPLTWVGEDLYCLSLRLLIRSVADGIYYKMLDACRGDDAAVNWFTSWFGTIFHEYVYDAWQRVAGRDRVKRLQHGRELREVGDGLVEDGPRLFIYDAKSTRFRLGTTRSGAFDSMHSDLQRGVLKAAQQLHNAILAVQSGSLADQLERATYEAIYPIVVTATDFPGIPTPYRAIDAELAARGLLTMERVAPLQVVDAEGLEVLEDVRSAGLSPLVLLAERAVDPAQRTLGVKDLIYHRTGQIPINARLKRATLAIMEGVEEWLKSGTLAVERIETVLFE